MKKIISLTTPVMNSDSHRGKTETIKSLKQLKGYLTNESDWTDDDILEDEDGNKYSIDELIGEIVQVGNKKIFITFSI